MSTFNDPGKEAILKHCWKRKNTGNQHFLLFLQCFIPNERKSHHFSHNEIVICKYFKFLKAKIFLPDKMVNPLPHNDTF